MKVFSNRYAWTDAGPVRIWDGKLHSTEYVRRALALRGISVERWARNHSEFHGWVITEATF